MGMVILLIECKEKKEEMDTMEIEKRELQEILKEHTRFFRTNKTKSVEFRKQALIRLYNSIKKYEKEIINALRMDLGKSEFEAYSTEIGYTLSSIQRTLKKIEQWIKPEVVRTPYYLMPAKECVIREPYGTVLIIGPFNYPFQLVIEPLIGAIAAGNCVVIKPSELTPNVANIVEKVIETAFRKHYICVVQGGIETNQLLCQSAFDYIFFTGSPVVGKKIMEAASKNLVPVTLELGGKSPVIVDETANLDVAAARIIWGKTINAGQTCIAPDYIYVNKQVSDKLVTKLVEKIQKYYGANIQESKDYSRIVNQRHFERLQKIISLEKENLVYGGDMNPKKRYIQPTIIRATSWDTPCMEEELFGPILPIIEYSDLNQVIESVQAKEKPLALYIFTEDQSVEKRLIDSISSGGVCVNDTIMHILNPGLPFGGVGNAGMGQYHGKYSFETFSHKRSICKKSTKISTNMIYPPYTKEKLAIIRRIFK